MMRELPLLITIFLLSACGSHKVEYGVASKTGVVFYPLCERAQYRITDLKRVSFMMPKIL